MNKEEELRIDTRLLREHADRLRSIRTKADNLSDMLERAATISQEPHFGHLSDRARRLSLYYSRMQETLEQISFDAEIVSHRIGDKIDYNAEKANAFLKYWPE